MPKVFFFAPLILALAAGLPATAQDAPDDPAPPAAEVSSWSVEDFVTHTLDDFLKSDDES